MLIVDDEDQSESDAISSLPPSGKQVFSTSETEDDSTTHGIYYSSIIFVY